MIEEIIVFRGPNNRIFNTFKLTDLSPRQMNDMLASLSDEYKIPSQDIRISLHSGPNSIIAKRLWLKNLVTSVKNLLAREYEEMDEKALKDAFKNLRRIPIAHSETEDRHEIQVYADLINLNFTTEVNRVIVERCHYQDHIIMQQALDFFDFDTAIGDAEAAWEEYQKKHLNEKEEED